jgi:hypothetical protein
MYANGVMRKDNQIQGGVLTGRHSMFSVNIIYIVAI